MGAMSCRECGAVGDTHARSCRQRGRASRNAQLDRIHYRSARSRGSWAQVFIGLSGIATVWSMAATFGEVHLLERIRDGLPVSAAEAAASYDRGATTATASLVTLVCSMVLFLVWLHRSVANLRSLEANEAPPSFRFTPGWAVAWFFLPIANLVRPYQVMRELYSRSNPAGYSSPLIGWWWASWIAGGIAAPGVSSLFGEPTLSELIADDYRFIVADALLLVAALVLIVLIGRIVAWQDRLSVRIGSDRSDHATVL